MKSNARTRSHGVLAWLEYALFLLFVGTAAPHCATGATSGDEPGGGFSDGSSSYVGSSSGGGDATIVVPPDTGSSIVYGGDDGGQTSPSGDDGGPLDVEPANPVLEVTIVDGIVTASSVTFTASASGTTVPAVWSLDQGAIGAIDAASGIFTASGGLPGVATVTASFGAHLGTTTVTVQLSVTNHGGTPAGDSGPAGYGGVGGEGPGGPANASVFGGTVTAPSSPSELSFLYPYDKTVWPRGLAAPLLQWTTTHTATAVYIHLSQTDFDFKGYYQFAAGLTPGPQLMRQPIDQTAWDQATHGNQGDALHAEVTIAAADGVFGPIAEDWIISPDILQGTVYYGTYSTVLNLDDAGNPEGAVMKIQPGVAAPTLAIPSLKGTCHVCHEVSANGSTLFAANGLTWDYGLGGSYDLTDGGALIKAYDQTAEGNGIGYYDVEGKFTYGGIYPDGTFALANSMDNWWSFREASNIFSRDTLLAIPSTGFTNLITQAVTPSFSPDGQHVAFNYPPTQIIDGGVTGVGHVLDAMDFDCGASAGSVTCGAPPYAFSNLRQIYSDPTRYPGWPSFTPDGNFVVLQSTINPSVNNGNSPPYPTNSVLNTYSGATAELMIADTRQPPKMQPQRLCALNGLQSDCATSYLPVVGPLDTSANDVPKQDHTTDTVHNYEPNVNPVASGGYFWVVFTSRRAYGNIAQSGPYDNEYGASTYPLTKKLWVAAIDENPTAGKDPSHPAFYLPGQELNAGDMKGYWVVDPCRPDGSVCTSGDQCCGGFCRSPAGGGALVCMKVVPGCANEFEKCITAADCCGAADGYLCLNGYCSEPSSPTKVF